MMSAHRPTRRRCITGVAACVSAGLLALYALAAPKPSPAAGPVTGPRLVLWLDAQDPGDAGQSVWADKSGHGNHASQPDVERRPAVRVDAATGLRTVRFDAAHGQYLSAGSGASLTTRRLTAFVVARADAGPNNMWLSSRNSWGPPWSGYGIAVNRDGLHPWTHLGLERDGTTRGAQLQHSGGLERLSIVELRLDGRRITQGLNGAPGRGVAASAGILANGLPLFIGACPQAGVPTEFLTGDIAELLIYNEALSAEECAQVRGYLAAKYGIALASGAAASVQPDERIAMTAEDATPETRTLTPTEATEALRRDWLYQAQGAPLLRRASDEIGWARKVAARIASAGARPGLAADVAELNRLAQRVRRFAGPPDGAAARDLYLAIRQVKRRILLRDPAVDFSRLLLVDTPYPQGGEWPHEALHHLGKRASSGGRLLTLDGLHPGGRLTRLMPGAGALGRPDVSFDGRRVLFCFKPHADKTYHLYEVGSDGAGLRQLTSGQYDDISPVYAPDGSIRFCTTRANSFVRCGPYIESTVLAKCDANGRGIYLISANNEPDYTPTVLPDGRLLYTRWEYTDKEQIRVQSLWTANPDGTAVSAYWGNQSFWPDMLFEARSIPGSRRVMFAGVGHHDVFSGSIGIVDRAVGLNYPAGLTKVTPDVPWAEVGDGPGERPERAGYHASGRFAAYRSPYPLSPSLFLVSARRSDAPHFGLYLMDVEGNRELITEGAYNILHAMPLRARRRPPAIPDRVAWPGAEAEGRPVAPGVVFSADVYAGLPNVPRGAARYLRVIQQDSSTFTLGRKSQQPGDTVTQPIMLGGPPLSVTVVDGIKRILGTVPIEADGSVCFNAPPGRALHFQLLDERGLAIQTMRSFANVMPGERRGCVGCHEMHSSAPQAATPAAMARRPRAIDPPPWGAGYTLGYERDIQPILDRHCGSCHQGSGSARAAYDLTLRPGAGVFKEPYVTLVLGRLANPTGFDWPPVGAAGIAGSLIPAAMPRDAMLKTVAPMTTLSYRSPLVALVMGGKHHGVALDPVSLQKLTAWIDLLCPYRGEPEIRAMADPDPAPFEADRWPILPRMATAPVVKREYMQDAFPSQEARVRAARRGPERR